MSECVVRMEMPKSCYVCPCLDDYGDYPRCRLSEEQRGYKFPIHEKRMPNCPIIAVLPEGHGRLIDADDCIKHLFTEWVKGEISNSEWCNIRQCMNEETTIVPAERS